MGVFFLAEKSTVKGRISVCRWDPARVLKSSSSPLLTHLLIGYWTRMLHLFLILVQGGAGSSTFLSCLPAAPPRRVKVPCPLQEKEVVEELPKEQEEVDVTAARTSTSQEEVGLEG